MGTASGSSCIWMQRFRDHSLLFSHPRLLVTRSATTRFIGQRPDTGVGLEISNLHPPLPRFPVENVRIVNVPAAGCYFWISIFPPSIIRLSRTYVRQVSL